MFNKCELILFILVCNVIYIIYNNYKNTFCAKHDAIYVTTGMFHI